jgi:serine/threonine-protein phosphatase 4 regulatory subunit 1
LLHQEDAEKLEDDNSSKADIIITPSVWDCISDDEKLMPLGLDKHASNEDIFTRQIEAQSLLDTLRAGCDNERDCIAVFERFNTLADDSDPIVRVELMEQVPHIALFCQENWPSMTFAFSKYLLSVVVRYLTDQNHEVCKTSQEVLLTLLEQELIGRFDVETKVCPVLMEMTV